MKRILTYIALAAVVMLCLSSCSKKGKVIPRGTMSEIYADIFIADQWLRKGGADARSVDTLLFYEPIFNEYGYTTEDFIGSAGYYLHDPRRFTRILKKSSAMLEARHKELEALFDNIENHEAEILEYRASTPEVPVFFDSLFFEQALDRVVDIQMNGWNVYMPVYDIPVPEDSLALCDSLAWCDSLAVADTLAVKDTVVAAVPVAVEAPRLLENKPFPARPGHKKPEKARMDMKEVLPVAK